MTSDTGIWSGVIIPVMANNALVRNGHMSSCKNIIIIVDREIRRGPVRIGGMTGCTLCRNTDRTMIRVSRLVVIGLVASGAGIGSVDIISLVTGKAVTGNCSMCASKRVNIVMIKYRGTPGTLRMTGFTGSRELRCDMVWICRLIIIARMTIITYSRCSSISIGVAFNAFDCCMGSCQGENGGVMIKCSF